MARSTTKITIVSQLVSIVVYPLVVNSAVANDEMQYISAAEGLHGSIRVEFFSEADSTQESKSGASDDFLRLWVSGTANLGGDLQTIYRWVWSEDTKAKDETGQIRTQAYEVGVRDSWGTLVFGKVSMIAPLLVPHANPAFAYNDNLADIHAPAFDHGIRYTSPLIHGIQVGGAAVVNGTKSATVNEYTQLTADGSLAVSSDPEAAFDFLGSISNDADNADGSLDQLSIAAVYALSDSLQAGAGLETIAYDGYSSYLINDKAQSKDNATGYRAGIRYGQADDWWIGYGFRSYDNYLGFMDPAKQTDAFTASVDQTTTYSSFNPAVIFRQRAGILIEDALDARLVQLRTPLITTVIVSVSAPPVEVISFNDGDVVSNERFTYPLALSNGDEGLEYQAHEIGASMSRGRITLSAYYSTEKDVIDVAADGDVSLVVDYTLDVNSGSSLARTENIETLVAFDDLGPFEFERNTTLLEAAYALGSRDMVVLGWVGTRINSKSAEIAFNSDIQETYLFYHIEF